MLNHLAIHSADEYGLDNTYSHYPGDCQIRLGNRQKDCALVHSLLLNLLDNHCRIYLPDRISMCNHFSQEVQSGAVWMRLNYPGLDCHRWQMSHRETQRFLLLG